MFWTWSLAMLDAIAKIFLVALVAGLLIRRGVLDESYIKGLSEVTVKVLLPALIFDKVLTNFHPYQDPDWWILPVLGFGIPVLFMGVAALFYLPNLRPHLNKLPLAALQNVGYLVLPIGQILYPGQFDQFALYVFLMTLGFNPALWTVGKVLISYEVGKTEIRLAEMITPPFVANVLAMILIFLHVDRYVPGLLLEPISILGQAAVPMGMFILGATLGTISIKHLPSWIDIMKLSFVKFVLTPGLIIVFLIMLGLGLKNPLLADFLVIEASAAPAANLIVIVRKYGGNSRQTAGMMLIMYLLAVVMMPLWLGVWKMVG